MSCSIDGSEPVRRTVQYVRADVVVVDLAGSEDRVVTARVQARVQERRQRLHADKRRPTIKHAVSRDAPRGTRGRRRSRSDSPHRARTRRTRRVCACARRPRSQSCSSRTVRPILCSVSDVGSVQGVRCARLVPNTSLMPDLLLASSTTPSAAPGLSTSVTAFNSGVKSAAAIRCLAATPGPRSRLKT
jgi:hypothetical protein